MRRGRQSLILRKGGLAEGRNGFQFLHREFFLYPTAFHEQVAKLREGSAEGLDPSPEERSEIVVRTAFRLEWATSIEDWAAAAALTPFHLYRDEVVRERFAYDDAPGLQVAFGRAYRVEPAWEFASQPSFGGCRSWLRLPAGAPPWHQFEPALDDAAHAQLSCQLETWLETHALTAHRFV